MRLFLYFQVLRGLTSGLDSEWDLNQASGFGVGIFLHTKGETHPRKVTH